MRIQTRAPATGAPLADLPVTSDDEVRQTVARARQAQRAWAVLPPKERAAKLRRLRDALADDMDALVDAVSLECGKPRQEALVHEVSTLLDFAGWVIEHAPRVLAAEAQVPHLLKHRTGEIRQVPKGVVGVISPWNFPLLIPMATVIEALAAGNACVVKPSEVTPLVLLQAKAIYDSTGLPEDLFGAVLGFGSTGQALIDAGIDHCVFTGAVSTGRKVGAACGARLVPCTLELGGKAPLIAWDDCDVERTARAIVWGGFANSGQACVAVERVYAHQAVYVRLVERARELTGTLRQGDPARGDVDLGAMIFAEQTAIAERHVDDAMKRGARLVCGGKVLPGPGRFFEPTILAECDPTMTVMRDEIFAPIVPFMRVDDEEQAVALANDSSLGLSAYVFTRSRGTARRFVDRVEAGSVVVNDVWTQYATAEAPFGGVKQSGFGRVHGEASLRELSQTKYVSIDRVPPPARDPLWFPYTSNGYTWVRKATGLLFGQGNVVRRISELL
jgi:succinate-semialdehyde dehydrogenase/glutarate-semialdehyde dehydrogenase